MSGFPSLTRQSETGTHWPPNTLGNAPQCSIAPNHQPRRPHCLPGAAGAPSPPRPQPRPSASVPRIPLPPVGRASSALALASSSLPAPTSCSLSAPPDAAYPHLRPSGRPDASAPTPRRLPGPLPRPPALNLRLALPPDPPGCQATPRLLGLPGSSDHPAPAPPRELLRRPQGSLGMLRRRMLE